MLANNDGKNQKQKTPGNACATAPAGKTPGTSARQKPAQAWGSVGRGWRGWVLLGWARAVGLGRSSDRQLRVLRGAGDPAWVIDVAVAAAAAGRAAVPAVQLQRRG